MPFPLFVDLADKPCLVVGGGPVAVRKAKTLADFGARVTVVAGCACNGQDARCPREEVRVVKRDFADADVEGKALVVAATDDAAVNRHVAEVCRARGVWVNVVDDPANCTFLFPAICRKGPIVAAVSSGGACPVAAKMVRDKVARLISDDFADEVARLGRERENLKRDYPDPQERKRVCEEALKKWNG